MLPKSLCFVDIETTGMSPHYNRILEIGIVKVHEGKVIREYKSLIHPQVRIDPFIQSLTGITAHMIEDAPQFGDIKDELYDLLKDSVFVAHNVRFDYGFMKNEFKRYGITFGVKHFCTVKLARLLYPNYKRYNLDAIIENLHIPCENRHRAFDDAKVLFDFYTISQKNIKPDLFEQAVARVLKHPATPIHVKQEDLDNLPESPGVYTFYGKNNEILYIGKSINIRDRVLSHFSNDYLSAIDMKIAKEIQSVEAIETGGELGALLLESTMIKKYQPLFNRQLRYARKMIVALKDVDEKGYSCVKITEMASITIDDLQSVIGIFKSRKQVKDTLYILAKENNLCLKLLDLENTKRHCFNYQLGLCHGACLNKELSIKYNVRFDEAFYKHKIKNWMFDGPIVIKEKNEGFVIDKWCVLGKISAHQGLDGISQEYRFDLDTYKILYKFLLHPQKNISIETFKHSSRSM